MLAYALLTLWFAISRENRISATSPRMLQVAISWQNHAIAMSHDTRLDPAAL